MISRFRDTRGIKIETDLNNLMILKVSQGEISNGGDKPETTNPLDQPKAKVKYSGAARRRYKKMQVALRAGEVQKKPHLLHQSRRRKRADPVR